ncbi:MAG: glutamate-ammonia-ligase adenylyltransferase [Porticoccaceae bacterium]
MRTEWPLSATRAERFARLREQFLDATAAPERERFERLSVADAGFAAELAWVWSASEFAAGVCRRQAEAFLDLAETGALQRPWMPDAIATALDARLGGCASEDDLGLRLRRFRNLWMLRIVWRDLTRKAPLEETLGALSELAEACVRGALAVLHPRACAQWGTPRGADSGAPQELVVVAMGKLGGGELNLSSDIDLIFAYPEGGETDGARSLDNQEFFLRLGRKLIRALDEHTAEGFVFRVDLRLRPYGDSGPLVASFDALADYYQTQGRDWERYAMIKARPISGSAAARDRLAALLRGFTYRKYIDYSVIQGLRDLKALINREVARRELADDVKLGRGGIREIEFIAQSFQLIRGGRDRRFQTQRLHEVLQLIDAEHLLPDGAGALLWRDYRLLRDTEHALQAWRDQQTQQLPTDPDARACLAAVLGYPDWAGFAAALDAARARVQRLFDAVVTPAGEDVDGDRERLRNLWLQAGTAAELAALGYGDQGDAAAAALAELHAARPIQAMTPESRARLDRVMPLIIADCAGADPPAGTLRRVIAVVAAVARRSVYLTLLSENPGARRQLVRLCAASPWIADELAQHPALLDELLDPAALYAPPDRDGIARELREHLARTPSDDLEAQMEALRYFRRAHALRAAAAEITGALPLMRVSDQLTWLAEAILATVLDSARAHLVARHGEPAAAPGTPPPGLLILGYGKLGGIELAHGSDLDLVFLHDADATRETTGQHPLTNEQFFIRLGQRIIHILSARTASGVLYEVDMRLRPSGNSGLLVSSLAAFARYQADSAWVWEHQALVRARAVAGSAALAERFAEIRHAVLCRRRERAALAAEVRAMREKMRAHLGSKAQGFGAGLFDLKQDPGGIVDIEFMVQFLVLAESHRHPELTRWTDNIRILGDLEAAGVLRALDAETLREAYKGYRMAGHRLQLQRQPALVPAAEFAAARAAVTAIWERLLHPNHIVEET